MKMNYIKQFRNIKFVTNTDVYLDPTIQFRLYIVLR